MGKCGIDHAVLADARLAAEGFCHDFYAEVALSLRVAAGVTGMLIAFINDIKYGG